MRIIKLLIEAFFIRLLNVSIDIDHSLYEKDTFNGPRPFRKINIWLADTYAKVVLMLIGKLYGQAAVLDWEEPNA